MREREQGRVEQLGGDDNGVLCGESLRMDG